MAKPDPEIITHVAENIAAVRTAQRDGLARIEAKWFGGEPARQAASNLRAMTPLIDDWADRGTKAAAAGSLPNKTGWPGWTKAGQQFVSDMEVQVGEALNANLELIKTQVADAPATSVKAVAKAAGSASKAVADVGGAVLRPFVVPLVLVGIAAVVVGVIYLRATLPKG